MSGQQLQFEAVAERDFSFKPARWASTALGLSSLGFASIVSALYVLAISTGGWIQLALWSKPLIDLTWSWEFINVFNQRVNIQAIVAVLVAALNCIVACGAARHMRHFSRIAWLLGLATLSVLISPSSWAINELVRLFAGVSLFFSAGLFLADQEKFDRFAKLFLASLCVPFSLSLLQVAGVIPFDYWDWLDTGPVGRASGTYQHPLEIIFFLVYALPIAFYLWEKSTPRSGMRAFLAVFFVLAAAALVFTYHRTGWFAVVIETGLWFALRGRKKMILYGAIALVLLGFAFGDWIQVMYDPLSSMVTGDIDITSTQAFRGRGIQWFVFATSYIQGGPLHWVMGRGGSEAEVYVDGIGNFYSNEAHDDFLRILHAYGIVGLFVYLSILLAFFNDARTLRRAADPFERAVGEMLLCAIAAILILSTLAEPMRFPTGIWYLFTLGSMAAVLRARQMAYPGANHDGSRNLL